MRESQIGGKARGRERGNDSPLRDACAVPEGRGAAGKGCFTTLSHSPDAAPFGSFGSSALGLIRSRSAPFGPPRFAARPNSKNVQR